MRRYLGSSEQCVKCGSGDVGVKFVADGVVIRIGCAAKVETDVLVCTCGRCGYAWTVFPLSNDVEANGEMAGEMDEHGQARTDTDIKWAKVYREPGGGLNGGDLVWGYVCPECGAVCRDYPQNTLGYAAIRCNTCLVIYGNPGDPRSEEEKERDLSSGE